MFSFTRHIDAAPLEALLDQVTSQGAEDHLSGKNTVVMVLTLLVGLDGRVIHGQILDPGGRPPLVFADLASLGNPVLPGDR